MSRFMSFAAFIHAAVPKAAAGRYGICPHPALANAGPGRSRKAHQFAFPNTSADMRSRSRSSAAKWQKQPQTHAPW